jgi:hypothetical protein
VFRGQSLGHVLHGPGAGDSLRRMGIVNRRNAVVGWLVVLAGKRWAKRKAKAVVPGTVDGGRTPNKPAILAALAALGGVLLFWRRRGDSGDDGNAPRG